MKLLRAVLLALLVSFLVGLAIGTVLRRRLERPTFYLALAALPGNVGDAGAVVLEAREHEEQVG